MAAASGDFALLSRILSEHGPLGEDELIRHIEAAGAADPESVMDDLWDEIAGPARQLLDDRWVWLPTLLNGRIFTHRVTAVEITYDLLAVDPDLSAVTDLCEYADYQRLVDGSPVHYVVDEFDDELLEERGIPLEEVGFLGMMLLLPAGTLSALGVADGDLVGVRLTGSGFAVERVDTPPPAGEVGRRIGAALLEDEPTSMCEALWAACVDDPTLFTEPSPPLREIIADEDFASSVDLLAPAGFDIEQWRFELQCQLLASRYSLSDDDALVVKSLVTVYEQMSTALESASDSEIDEAADSGGPPPPTVEGDGDLLAQLGSELSNPVLAEVLLQETVGFGGSPAALGMFAEALEPRVARSARAAFHWLHAQALERLGDIELAERELLTAESLDPSWPLSLLDLARYASDRGDVERGLSLLRRAGVPPDYPLTQLLEQHRPTARSDVGRNDPCWCGSGRKYKKCHLGHEVLPLEDRLRWLYAKACQHVFMSGWSLLLDEVAEARSQYLDEPPDSAPAADDPLPIDAVLFEGGAFAHFVQVRGALLPEDERLLAQQWQLVERSVFEVEQVQPGHSISVRNLRTGDIHDVGDRAASRHLKPGQFVCCRVVPGGETHQIFGGIEPVALHQRDELIDLLDAEPDPVELVDYLSRRFAPPALVNTEGDPLVLCEATVRPGDPDRIEALLDGSYARDDDESPQWHDYVTTVGMQRIRAVLHLDDGTLRVETNSEKRMDRVLATLASLDPSMTVLSDSRQPMSDARQAAELAKQMPKSEQAALDPDDPETAALLREFIQEYETKWLDEPIPALKGHTPRQAAEDPTRRPDLLKLLDSFPAPKGGIGMDANRLRDALGLR